MRTRKPHYAKSLAVVVIDMQPLFLELIPLTERKKLFNTQPAILEECARHDIPVLVLEMRNRNETVPQIARRVRRVPTTYTLTKEYDSGFSNPLMSHILVKWNVNSLVLMGVWSSCCVFETAQQAVSRGYRVHTGHNLIADKTGAAPNHRLQDWFRRKGHYSDTGKTLSQIMEREPTS